MADWNAIQAFMAHVVPWPATQQDPGYVNLHYSSLDRKDPTKMYKGGGWPFRAVETLIGRASWINTTDQFKDVWYCLSLQAQVKANPRTPAKPKAQRLAANALALKSIWIDADVGPKAGEYATLADALKALILFREQNQLPPYSALVSSGNGLHAYWISKTNLTVKEWAPYAEGLRALLLQDCVVKDPGLTTDPARILRVPGTFNHKDLANPKPVQLLNTPLVMYDFTSALAILPTVAPAVSTVQVNKSPEHPLFAEGANLDSFKQPALLAPIAGETLGSISHDDVTLDPRPIFTNCGFYREALRDGGKDYDNALWMYSVLGATFMENGNAISHQISKGHETYSEVDTQALYDRKVAERADRGIGYPSCAAIAGAGCKSCQTCPLFAKGKSPLNIRPTVTATVSAALNMALPGNQSIGAKDLCLPLGYDLDANGYICEVEEVMVNGDAMPPKLHQLFWSKLTEPWAQSNPEAINFTTTTDLTNVYQATIRQDEMGGMVLQGVWGKQKVKIFPRNKARLEHFIVSWLAKLHEMQASQQSLPFGWYMDGSDLRGFIYGSKLFKDDGAEVPCGVGDPKLRKIFQPSGDIQPWFDACKTITQQKRPELDAIIALSFASPLTALVGKNAMTLCAFGDSGVSKSAAYSVGIAVWGHAILGKAVSHSTFNAVMRKMGELSNLPLYWDEIKDVKAQSAVYDFIYTATDGSEKDRMKDGRDMQDKGSWQTLMMMASNKSFTDFILTKDMGHTAGLSRVLEYNIKKAVNPVGRIMKTDADIIFDKLKTSFGQMGMRYAKLLAMNHVMLKQRARDACNQVERDFNAADEERLWTALIGVLIVGAELANELGADLDVPRLKEFLYDVFRANRAKRDDMVSIAGSKSTVNNIMNLFLAKASTNDQVLYTRGMPSTPGSPAAVSILHQPKDLRNTAVRMAISVRWDVSGKQLLLSKDEFVAYLEENNQPVGTTLQALRTEYGMKNKDKMRLGAGVFTSQRLTCLVFDVSKPGHDWEDMLHQYSPPEERPVPPEPTTPVTVAVNPRPQPERVDTGFEYDRTTGLATADSVGAFVRGASRHAG